MSSLDDRVARRLVPRAVIAAAHVDRPARMRAAVRRALGGSGRVELYFAFDDPCSAVAVLDLVDRLAGRKVRLVLAPVVRRGLADDPAVGSKRRYALADARRRAARSGLVLWREGPLAARETEFLAEWASSAPQGPALTEFCVAALRRLWFDGDAPAGPVELAGIWRRTMGGEPPATGTMGAVRRNERRMRRRGPYDTPAAWVGGQWFFAHDRGAQIADRLDELGWRAAS